MKDAATQGIPGQGGEGGIRRLSNAEKRQRAYLLLVSTAVLALAIALSVHGWDYYTLGYSQRPFSSKHTELKPSGTIGLKLGITGFTMLALVYLYPLRKYWPALGRVGKTKNWFNFHVFLGLSAPAVITFHCAFKTRGFAGMAYWAMIALVVSGLIGRYF